MADKVVATIERARDTEQLRATLNEYKGSWYAHLRIYFRNDADEWCPTRQGVSISADRFEELEAAVRALRKAIDEAPRTTSRPGRRERYRRERAGAGDSR
jgi:hypothetical protein